MLKTANYNNINSSDRIEAAATTIIFYHQVVILHEMSLIDFLWLHIFKLILTRFTVLSGCGFKVGKS